MNSIPTKTKPTELEQAAADRRSFGNTELAANAEFKVIAEAMRELVTELRRIRMQLDQVVAVVSKDSPIEGSPPASTPGANPAAAR